MITETQHGLAYFVVYYKVRSPQILYVVHCGGVFWAIVQKSTSALLAGVSLCDV